MTRKKRNNSNINSRADEISNLNCRANRVQTKACFQYAEVQPTIKRSLNLKSQISNLKIIVNNPKKY